MKDISLYGHLTIDTIIDGTKEKKTLGSMANVWKALLNLNCSLDIGISPIDIGHALIYIDIDSSKRYSKANLNLIQKEPKIFKSKIHHITYLNEISNCNFIESLDGIITADICSGCSVSKDVLKYIDYLFISDEDIDGDFSDYLESTKGWVILHDSFGSLVSNGKEQFYYRLPDDLKLSKVNVLGAGDIFASCFLYKLLEGHNDIQEWIKFAHLKTTQIIGNSI